MTYENWIEEVDRIVTKNLGVGLESLPDWLSHDAFERGATPQEGAQECLDNAETYGLGELAELILFDEL